jgi:EAL and modified HD-GYP domain-containing signal transduction protein
MDLFVARQPIFDRERALFAYELLFRSGPENAFPHGDGDHASSSVIGHGLLSFGLDALVGDRRAFVNVTRNVLLRGLWSLFPRERVVVELLEDVPPDPEVVEACRALKQAGYLLALDDFVQRPDYAPLVELADIVKVDFLATQGAQRRALAQALRGRGVELLAEKVETGEDVAEGIALGYAYFQGFFFEKPEMVSRRDVPGSKLNYLRFLREVDQRAIDLDRLEEVIKQEVSLSVRLLRYLNAAVFGWREPIDSIKHALLLVGEETLRKLAWVVAMKALGEDKSQQLVLTSLHRARFCEAAAPHCGLGDRGVELFLVGLLSLVDALVGRPMDELLAELAVSADVRAALTGRSAPFGPVLCLAESWERGDWERVAALSASLGLPEAELPGLQGEAIAWASAALSV